MQLSKDSILPFRTNACEQFSDNITYLDIVTYFCTAQKYSFKIICIQQHHCSFFMYYFISYIFVKSLVSKLLIRVGSIYKKNTFLEIFISSVPTNNFGDIDARCLQPARSIQDIRCALRAW